MNILNTIEGLKPKASKNINGEMLTLVALNLESKLRCLSLKQILNIVLEVAGMCRCYNFIPRKSNPNNK